MPKKLALAKWLLFSMCLTNPLRKVMQNMVSAHTCKHISQKRICGTVLLGMAFPKI